MTLTCVYREPFSLEPPRVQRLPEGKTLAELTGYMRLPDGFADHGTVCINGQETPREAWHLIKPKALSATGVPVQITFHAPLRGGGDGGGGGGKQVLAVVAGIGLSILSGGAAAGLFATSGGLFTAQSTSALLLAGAISLAGSLLLNALVPPPSLNEDGSREVRRDASARGNVLAPNGSVPRVVGERRMFPPLLAEPLITFDGEDEIAEAVFGLSGPHRLLDLRVGSAPVEDIPGLEVQTRDGFPGAAPQTLVRRYARTDAVQTELRGHTVDPNDGKQLDPLIDVSLAVPQATILATRAGASEHELQIALPQGLGRPAEENDLLRIPIRVRIRPFNGDWVNLPEIHYQGNDFRQLRATIKLSFREPPPVAPTADSRKGFVTLYTTAPGQTQVPEADGWEADSYFHDGSGDDYVTVNNLGSTGIRRYRIRRGVCEFFLDPATFSATSYEIEVKRGLAIRAQNWSVANYQYSSTVYDLFGYFGTPAQIPFSRDGVVDTLALVRSVSIYNKAPVQGDDFALIAVRARNVVLDRLSVKAGGYVQDWTYATPYFSGAPDNEFDQNDTVAGETFNRSEPIRGRMVCTFPDAPEGVIWEQGGASRGAYLGVSDGFLVFRAGSGGLPGEPEVSRLTVPVNRVAGKTLELLFDIRNRVRLWIFDESEGNLIGPFIAKETFSGLWSGSNAGAIGRVVSSVVQGENTEDFNGTISAAQFWDGSSETPLVIPDPLIGRWRVTSNPAPHLRDIYIGMQNAERLRSIDIDDDTLLEWRARCDVQQYQCNAVLQDTTVPEAAQIVAANGFARPYQSEVYGVVQDYDRSGEAPVQVFTPRNTRSFSWTKAFPQLPDGLRVNFDDAARDYTERQLLVWRDGAISNDSGRTEQITYRGATTEAEAVRRALYDLGQIERRSTFYSFEASADSLVCRRGSLVALVTDAIDEWAGYGRVEAGGADEIALDSIVPISNEPHVGAVSDFAGVEDVSVLGRKTIATIRRGNGDVVTAELSNDTGASNVLTFSEAINPAAQRGDLVAVGLQVRETKRLIVFGIEPREGYEATVTLVDEAQELFA